jgi:predicted MFS family arabinose efflux permease
MATQDIAVDAYTVEHLSDRERAAGAGVLDIARNVASFSAMAGIVTIYGIYGWRTATVVASLLLVLFSLPALLRRETPRAGSSSAVGAPRPSLLAMLKRPDSHLVLPVVMVVGFVGALISSLYVAYLVDMGFSTKEIGPLILAPASLLGTLIGATVTVWVLSRIGYRRTILLAAFLMVPTVGPIVWMGSLSPPSMLIVFLVTLNAIVLPTFLQVAIAASRMKWVLKSQAGTDFSVQVVAVSIAANAALAIGGVLAEALGWFWYFILSGVLVVAGCFVFYIAFARIEALVEARDRAIDEGDRRAEAERAAPEAAQPPLRSSDSPAV